MCVWQWPKPNIFTAAAVFVIIFSQFSFFVFCKTHSTRTGAEQIQIPQQNVEQNAAKETNIEIHLREPPFVLAQSKEKKRHYQRTDAARDQNSKLNTHKNPKTTAGGRLTTTKIRPKATGSHINGQKLFGVTFLSAKWSVWSSDEQIS